MTNRAASLLTALSTAILLVPGCGSRQVLPPDVVPGSMTGLEYTWQEGDTWRFLAWAIMDSDSASSAEALSLLSGFRPGSSPAPGDRVVLPLDPSLSDALDNRMDAARLVREATQAHEAGDEAGASSLLWEAAGCDPAWSVPAWDLALLQLQAGNAEGAAGFMEPFSDRPRGALLLSRIAWDAGRTPEAMHAAETALLADEPSDEARACAALIYTVTGRTYEASRLWLEILADPDAASHLRLLAVRSCLLLEGR